MKITATITGDRAVAAELNALASRARANVLRAVSSEAIALRNAVVASKLQGQVLNVRTGRLQRSITQRIDGAGTDTVSGIVGTNVTYARIHELGGQTKAHVIKPKTKKALFFGGKFVAKVNHPGSKIPARPFLSTALVDRLPNIKAALEQAVARAVRP